MQTYTCVFYNPVVAIVVVSCGNDDGDCTLQADCTVAINGVTQFAVLVVILHKPLISCARMFCTKEEMEEHERILLLLLLFAQIHSAARFQATYVLNL